MIYVHDEADLDENKREWMKEIWGNVLIIPTNASILDIFPVIDDIYNSVSGHVECVVLLSKVNK